MILIALFCNMYICSVGISSHFPQCAIYGNRKEHFRVCNDFWLIFNLILYCNWLWYFIYNWHSSIIYSVLSLQGSLHINLNSISDSIGFSQSVHRPTHSLNHILDLVLAYGIESEQLTGLPHNSALSEAFLIAFESVSEKNFIHSRCLSE